MSYLNLTATTAVPLVALFNPGAILVHSDSAPRFSGMELSDATTKMYAVSSAASNLERGAGKLMIKIPANGVREPGSIMRALTRLRSFASWDANWDGDGAPAPDKA